MICPLKVSGSLKLLYSQYRELQSFAQFGSDLDKDTKQRLALGERIVAVLKQKNNSPLDVALQVCIIYAVVNGYLTKLRVDQIPEFERRLAEHMELKYPDFAENIHNTGKMDEAMEAQLKDALQALLADYEIAV